jgi:hypothetical protein
MKTKLSGILFLVALFALGAHAQKEFDGRSLDGIKQDFKSVGAVAHVKILNIKFAADDIHPLYAVESEVIEIFKGKIEKQKTFTFYFHAEEGFDVKRLIEKDWIVFLEAESLIPAGGKGWYELENSKITASKKLIVKLRNLKIPAEKAKKTKKA